MGRTTTEVTIENLGDIWDAENGRLAPENVRRVTVDDALVDTGASFLSLPTRLIKLLGFRKLFTRKITTSLGTAEAPVYGPARLTIMGRFCTADVMEVPDSVPVLIGQIPLEAMDWVVDPKNQKLIGNPAHGGEHIIEAY